MSYHIPNRITTNMQGFIEILCNVDTPQDIYDLTLMNYIQQHSCISRPRSINNPYNKEVTKMSLLVQKYGSAFSRAYRMSVDNFYRLHTILLPHLTDMFTCKTRATTSSFYIPTEIRLSIALRFFAGGDPYDLSIIHNVCRESVYDSVWGVVDCINQCTTLSFSFPSLTEQQDICAGYKRRSWINLPNIIGAIDGILVWVKTFH